jgi:sodium/potassium/calcium exchanger 6
MKDVLPWLLLVALMVGGSLAVLILMFLESGVGGSRHPFTRILLCLMGFVVAVVWIMAIADEVVQVLVVSTGLKELVAQC